MRSDQAGELLLAETAASAGTRPSARRPCSRSSAGSSRSTAPGWRSPTRWATATTPWRASTWTSRPWSSSPVRVNARDIEVTGANRARPPLSPSDLPYPAEELPTWAECLIPAGIHEALVLALFAPGDRQVGFLALLSGSRQPPSPATRRRLAWLAPVLAHGIDPMRSLSPPRAWCGGPRRAWCCARTVAARRCQACRRMRCWPPAPPSWPPHVSGSVRGTYSSFLWPWVASRPGRARTRHRPGGSRGRAVGADRPGPAVKGDRAARADPAGDGGAGAPGRRVLQPGDRPHARRDPPDRGHPPRARPRQARGTDPDMRRGPRRTGWSLRSRPAPSAAARSSAP